MANITVNVEKIVFILDFIQYKLIKNSQSSLLAGFFLYLISFEPGFSYN